MTRIARRAPKTFDADNATAFVSRRLTSSKPSSSTSSTQTDVCFKCRKQGHTIASCPLDSSSSSSPSSSSSFQQQKHVRKRKRQCYKCGSHQHSLSSCPSYSEGDALKHATCFVCNETGHIAMECPVKQKQEELKRCKEEERVTQMQLAKGTAVGLMTLDQGADDDDNHISLLQEQKEKQKQKHAKEVAERKKPKVVVF